MLKVPVTSEVGSHLDSRNQGQLKPPEAKTFRLSAIVQLGQTGRDLCGNRNDPDLLTRPRVDENVCLVKSGSSNNPCVPD